MAAGKNAFNKITSIVRRNFLPLHTWWCVRIREERRTPGALEKTRKWYRESLRIELNTLIFDENKRQWSHILQTIHTMSFREQKMYKIFLVIKGNKTYCEQIFVFFNHPNFFLTWYNLKSWIWWIKIDFNMS